MTDLSFPKDIPTPAGFYIIFLLILIIPYPFLKYNPYFASKKQKECKRLLFTRRHALAARRPANKVTFAIISSPSPKAT
jgi:hypothetical protein